MSDTPAGRVIPRLRGLGFGGDWNPEQWPQHVWDEDLRLMREANVNLVTVGVFSWAYLEPTPGHYEFGWLDTVLDKCLAAGVSVDLATATASPPPWLGHRWPESLPVTDDGTTWYAMAQATLNQLDCDIERLFEWLGDYEPDTPTPEVPS